MHRRVGAAHERCLELERVIADRARSGSLRLDDALKLFDELLPCARAASVTAFNHLLAAVSRVVSLFNRMVRECSIKVAPNLCTYSILIGCFCRMGCPENGFAAFGLILKTGWRVNGIVVNQLLKGLCDAKRVGEAMDILLQRMPELGFKPDVVSYNTVLKGFCNEKRAEEALELLHMMSDGQGVSPDVVTCNTVIDGLCKAEMVDKAEGVFQQMNDKGVKPDNVTYTCLIHGYLSTGQWEEVVPRFKEMSSHGLEPDGFTYGLLLDYLCKNGNCSEARIFFDSMIRKGIKPDITIYGIMLHGYGTRGALSEMHDLLNLMAANGISPNHHIFNTVLCAIHKQVCQQVAVLVSLTAEISCIYCTIREETLPHHHKKSSARYLLCFYLTQTMLRGKKAEFLPPRLSDWTQDDFKNAVLKVDLNKNSSVEQLCYNFH